MTPPATSGQNGPNIVYAITYDLHSCRCHVLVAHANMMHGRAKTFSEQAIESIIDGSRSGMSAFAFRTAHQLVFFLVLN